MREQVTFSLSEWEKWILDAIRKIRTQKQRPSAERICHAVRHHHPHREDVIREYLEQLVSAGTVLKVFNKGQNTYKDPGGIRNSRQLKLTKDCDLSKVICRAARELREKDGSSLKSIEKYIQQSHTIELSEPDVDLSSVIKLSAKQAVEKGLVVHDGKLYRAVEQEKCVDKAKPKKVKSELVPDATLKIEVDSKSKLLENEDKPENKPEKDVQPEDKVFKVPKPIRKKRTEKHNESPKVSLNLNFS